MSAFLKAKQTIGMRRMSKSVLRTGVGNIPKVKEAHRDWLPFFLLLEPGHLNSKGYVIQCL